MGPSIGQTCSGAPRQAARILCEKSRCAAPARGSSRRQWKGPLKPRKCAKCGLPMIDENAFGLLVSYYSIEEDEYEGARTREELDL